MHTYSDSSVEVMNLVVKLAAAEKWREVAELCDALSLRRFREDIASDLAEADLDVVREDRLGEIEAIGTRTYARAVPVLTAKLCKRSTLLGAEVGFLNLLGSFVALSEQEVFSTWLRRNSLRGQIEIAEQTGRLSGSSAEHFLRTHPMLPAFEIVGSVSDAGRYSHVLYRASHGRFFSELCAAVSELRFEAEFAVVRAPLVATFRMQDDGQWRILAGRNFLQMPSMPSIFLS
jgi:hypothetical protein